MDYIHIDNLFFRGKHGAYIKERRVEQEFSISIKLGIDVKPAGKSDKLVHTVDYSEIKDIIKKVIEGSSRYLLEKLAEDMAVKILKVKRVHSVEITIRKPEVWKNGIPGVTITRSK